MILKSTRMNGVYYRESDSKKFNGKLDRCFYIKYYRNKKQIQEKIGSLSEGYSAQIAADVRLKRLSGEQKRIDTTLSFDDAAKIYIDWAKNNKKTWLNDPQRYNKHIKTFLGSMKLADIKTSHIHEFIATLNEYKLKTVKIILNNRYIIISL